MEPSLSRRWTLGLLLLCALGCSRCKDPVECVGGDCVSQPTPFALTIPPFFPPMDIPEDNPLTEEGVALGRMLFWETALSVDQTISCGSCHLPAFGFSDPSPVSTGVGGAQGFRNSMALINVGWAPNYFWDGRALTLEEQILEPIPHPDEMALPWPEAVERLTNLHELDAGEPDYPAHFQAAFGNANITPERVAQAIAQFLRTLISSDSKYDRWRRGEIDLTDEEYNGYLIFLREGGDPETTPGGQFGGDCFHCHSEAGTQFSDYLFHNNGLDAHFDMDPGHAAVSGLVSDSGRFKTPTLRNIALTAPYMHDGRFSTLEEVVDHYNTGGVASATIDPFMKYSTGGLQLTDGQKSDIIAFLLTLTDTSFVGNSAFSNPH
ncbi:MAG: cytochrome-c peroxidase [Flavobacteriales bacterium]